jgi:ABC-type phosphate/phosphonate transport system substrate-binding protein
MNEQSKPGEITRRQFTTWLAAAASCVSLARVGMGQTPSRLLRVGVSVETLSGANVTDARGAYKVWAQEVINRLSLKTVELVPGIFISSYQMVQMIRQGTIGMFGITAWEFSRVVNYVDQNEVLLEEDIAQGMNYVLLVHNASPYKKLGDLRGRQIAIHHHRHMNLLSAWIGNMLAAENLPRMDAFFSQQVVRDSVTQVILPVFFHRMDAAALLRTDYETAVEMNPQLGRDLHALAISPNIIPTLCGFNKNCNPETVKQFLSILSRSESLPSGQEIVALYQSRKLVNRPTSCMNLTVNMLRQYERVTAQPPGQRKEHS